MKKNLIAFESFNAQSMSAEEIMMTNGGTTAWEPISYLVGATLKCIWIFANDAVEYQQSLPANLKK